MIKKVRNKEIATKIWLGGVCCVPRACLRIDITIITLVNAVIPKTKDGKIVNAVIKASIFKDKEYVLVPFADSVIVKASSPPGETWAEVMKGNNNTNIKRLNFLIW